MLLKVEKTQRNRYVQCVFRVLFSVAWVFIICYPALAEASDSALLLRISGLTRVERIAGAEKLLQEVAGAGEVVLVRLHIEAEPEWCEAIWSIDGDEATLARLQAEIRQRIEQSERSGQVGAVQVSLVDDISRRPPRPFRHTYAGTLNYRHQPSLGFE